MFEGTSKVKCKHTVRRLLTALLPRVAAVLVPTMIKPSPVVAAAEPEAIVVVAGDVPVVLWPLASMRPPPEFDVV